MKRKDDATKKMIRIYYAGCVAFVGLILDEVISFSTQTNYLMVLSAIGIAVILRYLKGRRGSREM